MNCEKKVSVVLPTYNGEQYVEESIRSVLTQTYQNLELIIVDDCSTDGTPEIIRRFAEEDSRVRLIRNAENQKLPRALNIGFAQASGDYFTWTSDDNCYDKDAIEVMVSFLEENPQCGMVYCDIRDLLADGTISPKSRVRPPRSLYVGSYFGACFLYRRQAAEAVGEYDPDMILAEDYDFMLRFAKRFEIRYLPVCKYTYRIHPASLSQTKTRQVWRQLWRVRYRDLDDLLAKTNDAEKQALFLDMWLSRRRETWELREKFFPNGELPERLKWMEGRMAVNTALEDGKPLILFGAGEHGQRALNDFGRDAVECFADNDPRLTGTLLHGVPVISFKQLLEIRTPYQLVLSVGSRFLPELIAQLEGAGIVKYSLFLEIWMDEEE